MPSDSDGSKNHGAYRAGDTWRFFTPPFATLPDHKADVLHHLEEQPEAWFPHLRTDLRHLGSLRSEHIVLVDDQPTNFESPFTGRKVARFCMVDRFVAEFGRFGVQTLGGLGARSQEDFAVLQQFIEGSWSCTQDSRSRSFCDAKRDLDVETEMGSSTDGSSVCSTRRSSVCSTQSSFSRDHHFSICEEGIASGHSSTGGELSLRALVAILVLAPDALHAF